MHQLARLARRGNEVVPAARDVRLLVEAKDASADRIAMMMVVEEPAVVTGVAQSCLNRFQVHSGILPFVVPAPRRIRADSRRANQGQH